jgi:hypothetical protein
MYSPGTGKIPTAHRWHREVGHPSQRKKEPASKKGTKNMPVKVYEVSIGIASIGD